MKQEPTYPTGDRFRWLASLLRDLKLTYGDKCVATYIIMIHFNDWTGQCDPSVPTIAKGVGMTERGVRTCLNRLNEHGRGFLKYELNRGGHSSQTNNYMYTEPEEPVNHSSGGTPCTSNQGSPSKKHPTPEQNGTTPCTAGQRTPEQNGTTPLNDGSAKHLTEHLREHSLEQVRSLARTTPPVSKSEGASEGKKRTCEGRKPEARATLERIENGIAYVKVADHDARLQVIARYDELLSRIRTEFPSEKVD